MSTSVLIDSQPAAFSESATFVELLRSRARLHPERTAYVFLANGDPDGEQQTLTYGELDQRARAIAAWLQTLTARGERALLLYPPGLEYITVFFGCLYAGVVAVPAYPPRHNRNLLRLQSLIADADPALALTTPSILSRVVGSFDQNAALARLRWLTTEGLETDADDWREPALTGDDLAFLQYTSGSTASPKGVMLSHSCLLHNDRLLQQAFGQTEESVIAGWLPLYHDMGLIGIVLHSLSVGARAILMSPIAFLQQPFRWLQTISHYRATTSGGPNFAYDLCVRKLSEEQRAALDLSSWTVAFNGAEPVRAETMDRFAETFASCGFRREAFRPCYGLAEATLLVSSAAGPRVESVAKRSLEQNRLVLAEGEETRLLVACGEPLLDQVLVVNPESLTKCKPGEVGEIWVSGPSVARGYWNNPAETARTFQAALDGETTFLRTGDLGAIRDGALFLTGRLKDLIILRGRNHYPQDIELTVEQSHPSLRPGCGAAFSVKVEDEERLVVVQETDQRRSIEFDPIIATIREAVSREHEAQLSAVVLVRTGTIPKTSSGKIQRNACRGLFLEGGLEIVAESSRAAIEIETAAEAEGIEAWLRAEFAALLKLDQSRIDIHEPIMRYGLDSLQATELAHRLESRLGASVSLATLLENPTLAQLASMFEDRSETPPVEIIPSETAGEYPLSFGQQSLWFLHRMAPDSAAYNLVTALRIRGALNVTALDRTFDALVQRHATLRTTFSDNGDAPVQQVHESLTAGCEYVDASSWSDTVVQERLSELAHQPFALRTGPVLRVRVLKRSDREHLLLFVVHHIAVDFWSLALLMKELGALYEAECRGVSFSLPNLTWRYVDHVRQQAAELNGPRGQELWQYWQTQLSANLPALDLPSDRPRPAVQTFHGSSLPFVIDADLTRQLKELARTQETTLYVVLLAAFQTLLYRYTEQREFAVGSPAAGRNSAKLSSLVGYFVNTLALRADLSGDPSFVELLARVRRTTLDAFAHQDFPFALLVERLAPVRDASRTPLFQHMFVMQQSDFEGLAPFALGNNGAQLQLGDLLLESVALERRVSLFDLKLEAAETGATIAGSLEYNTDLFETATIKRMLDHFATIVASVATRPNERLSRQSMLPASEQRQLLIEWNNTGADYSRDVCLHEFFETQAARTPQAIALVSHDERITYAELNQRANQLAHRLRRLGAGPESLVGVLLDRSPSLLVALLGVLKAGAAYVPLDPGYPSERVRFMLADAGVAVLLTQQSLRNELPAHDAHVVCLDAEWASIANESDNNPQSRTTPANLAYVIYTSGSTGKPKGVAIEHRSAATFIQWARDSFAADALKGVLASTSVCFDLSIFEIFVPPATGGKVILAANALELPALAAAGEVTLINTVPSAMTELLRIGGVPDSVRAVNLAGEQLQKDLVQRIYELPNVDRVANLYGPSEDTTYSTWTVIDRADARAPTIGRPVADTQVYLLDAQQQPVPIGVTGELYIAGEGLARGYLNRPAPTAEKFMPHPFSSEPGARMYRTGDLSRYLPDGRIEFLGRMDHQVKLRGFRVELGEIETALRKHQAVRDCVVSTAEVAPGDARLIAYVVYENASDEPGTEELRSHLKKDLPDYMLPAYFVTLPALPLSPNGKIDRRALPQPTFARPGLAAEFLAPRTELEASVARIWEAVLGLERVGIHDNFFELGGHSLLATQIVARLNQSFRIDFPLRRMFETPTVAGLAEGLAAAMRDADGPSRQLIARVPRGANLPLSFAQQRLWFLEQLEPGSSAYNMPIVLRIAGALDVAVLERSIAEVINRHEVLRTSITNVSGNPAPVVAQSTPWNLRVLDLTGASWSRAMDEATQEAHRPFDLTEAPLLRATIWRLDSADHLLALVMHHIVSDGWSLGVFAAELNALYRAFAAGLPSPLPELSIQYADFAHWQRQRLATETLDQLAYWKHQLAGELPLLELPNECSRAATPEVRVATQSWTMPPALHERLKELGHRHEATPFMILLAALQVLLHRYTGLEDVLVGTPVAGRTSVETEKLIGLFANTLVLRGDLTGNLSFVELLHRVRELTLQAHTHQDVPFEMLVEELQPERDLNRTPLFQVMIVLQNAPLSQLALPGLQVQEIELPNAAPKFDLILFLREIDDELHGSWEYNTERLDHDTVARMAQHFLTLLESVAVDPATQISDLEMLPAGERRQLLMDWNDTAANYAQDPSIHQLLTAQAARTPTSVALISGSERITYAELNERSNQLAHYLREQGCRPESLVGVLMERSISLIVALLGVLKAGGAYIPLDPAYPRERLRLTLDDAGADFLLTEENLRDNLPPNDACVVCLDSERQTIAEHSLENPENVTQPANLAYVIYTSGSTGRPKGVAIEHASVVTFIQWAHDSFTASQLAGVLASTSICFDLSIFEIFAPLAGGGKVILAANALELPALEAAGEVTLINTVPSAMTELIRMRGVPDSVRVVNLAGEPLKGALVQRIYELGHVEQVFNLYGPTEDTTYSTWSLIEKGSQPTIGQPIANTQAYVLDARLRPVPIGVTGELFLAGDGLARGYLNKPALTAGRFTPDPFSADGRMYRTGDLARYLSDGRLEFLGRSDHQVKLRGFRIELGEIETLLEAHPAVQDVIVIARQSADSDQQLVAYVVAAPDQSLATKELRAYLSERLPKHTVPSFIVPLAELPLTPNGKVDRKRLPAPDQSDERQAELASPRTVVEAKVARVWSQLLNRRELDVNEDFFALGGHSLLAVQVVSRLQEEFQIELPIRSIFESSTVAELAHVVENARQTAQPPIVPALRTGPLPVSFAQQRLWLLDQLAPGSSAYNILGGMHMRGELEATAFAQALDAIIERHEILRTTFTAIDGRPVQLVNAAQAITPALLDLRGLPAEERETKLREFARDELNRAFDLAQGPLMRVGLVRLAADEHVALVTMHHIVSDGWSMGVFVNEFVTLYRSIRSHEPAQLAVLPIQYADYGYWQRGPARENAIDEQLEYWRRKLAGTPPMLELQTDYPRTVEPTLRGERLTQTLAPELSQALRELSRREGVTLFMTLLAAFKTLLFRSTHEDDVLIGTAIAGRNRAEVEHLIGIFINMLVLRTDLSGNPTFRELLGRVRHVTLEAYAHQNVPFERLVEELQPARVLSRSPFFQIAFGLDYRPVQKFTLPDLELTPVHFQTELSRYDLTLWVFESEPELTASWTFNTDLFKAETIERLHVRFETLLSSVVKDPETRLLALELFSDEEREQAAVRLQEQEESNVKKLMSVRRRPVKSVAGSAS